MPVPWKCAAGLFLFGAVSLNQTSLQVTLRVEVRPESRLDTSHTTLRFAVPATGPREIRSTAVTLDALARPAQGQRVRLLAHSDAELQSQSASAPLSTVHWGGAKIDSRAGGNDAQCTSGQLQSHVNQDLVTDWTRGGSVSCTVTFIMSAPPDASPGIYTAPISFDLRLE